MVTKKVFETYDKAKIDELLANAGGGSWVPLTVEEYTDGSVWDSATYELKKDLIVCLGFISDQRIIYYSSVVIPKGSKADGYSYTLDSPNIYDMQLLGACYGSLEQIFSQNSSVSISYLRLNYTESNGVFSIGSLGSAITATRGHPTGTLQKNTYFIEVYRSD